MSEQRHESNGQLILGRKVGEQIMIGDSIVLTIIAIERGKVRLGVTAPRHVGVFREELLSPDDPRRQRPPTQ